MYRVWAHFAPRMCENEKGMAGQALHARFPEYEDCDSEQQTHEARQRFESVGAVRTETVRKSDRVVVHRWGRVV